MATGVDTRSRPARQQSGGPVGRLRVLLDSPVATYYIILLSVVALTGLGLVMVLSASSITSYRGGHGSSFSVFFRQAGYAVVGLVSMYLVSLLRPEWLRRIAPLVILLALALQVLPLIPGLGADVAGNQSWIRFAGVQLQPAEFSKLAIALYLASFMAGRHRDFYRFGHLLPGLAAIVATMGLVLAGKDLGTGMVVILVVIAALFVGGLPVRWLVSLAVIAVGTVSLFVFTSANRLDRIAAMFAQTGEPGSDSHLGTQWQTNHGLYALASGGWTGVGLGASREKWSWLPEAHNDFIFAIIGEELGLVGTLAVILVFALLGYGCVRLICRTDDRFVQAVTGGIFMWLIGQAAINICVVAGILPVVGVPLPFVSYGGSSLIATLLASGVLLGCARREEGAAAAMSARGRQLRSALSIFARKPVRKK